MTELATDIQAGRACPYCRAAAPAQICPACGRDTTAPRKICKSCGKVVPAKDAKCWSCGTAFTSEMTWKIPLIIGLLLLASTDAAMPVDLSGACHRH